MALVEATTTTLLYFTIVGGFCLTLVVVICAPVSLVRNRFQICTALATHSRVIAFLAVLLVMGAVAQYI